MDNKIKDALLVLVSKKVNNQFSVVQTDESDYDGNFYYQVEDSFGEESLRSHCEPEDATWNRDLQDNFWIGVSIGIRNTLKVIQENTLEGLIKEIESKDAE